MARYDLVEIDDKRPNLSWWLVKQNMIADRAPWWTKLGTGWLRWATYPLAYLYGDVRAFCIRRGWIKYPEKKIAPQAEAGKEG